MQLGLFLKKVLSSDGGSLSKTQLREVISKYLSRRTSFVSQDISNFCICGGRKDAARPRNTEPRVGVELLDIQQKQLEVLVLRPFTLQIRLVGIKLQCNIPGNMVLTYSSVIETCCQELKALFKETKLEMHEAQFGWEKEIESLGEIHTAIQHCFFFFCFWF